MFKFIHLLGDNDGLGGAIVVIIMIVGWAINAMSKLQKNQRVRAQHTEQQMRNASLPAPPPPPRQPEQMDAQEMLRRARAMASRQPARAPVKTARPNVQVPRSNMQAARQRMPAAAVRRPAPPPPVIAQEIPQPVIASVKPVVTRPVVSPVSATAPVIRKWLRPGTLRSQFILTEIFQKPLALREEHLP
jgi:hypothetical protein